MDKSYIAFDIRRLHILSHVGQSEHQQYLYESVTTANLLKFTADIDIEYDFSGCRLDNCSPKITD